MNHPGFSFEFIPNELPQIPKREYKPYIGLEDHFQISAATFLNSINALWFHCPNGGLRDKNIARKFKAMGLKPGVPDILIWDQRNGYNGFAIELKCGYNKTTNEQEDWLSSLKKLGWLTLVTYSLDQFIEAVEWYYGIKTVAQLLNE